MNPQVGGDSSLSGRGGHQHTASLRLDHDASLQEGVALQVMDSADSHEPSISQQMLPRQPWAPNNFNDILAYNIELMRVGSRCRLVVKLVCGATVYVSMVLTLNRFIDNARESGIDACLNNATLWTAQYISPFVDAVVPTYLLTACVDNFLYNWLHQERLLWKSWVDGAQPGSSRVFVCSLLMPATAACYSLLSVFELKYIGDMAFPGSPILSYGLMGVLSLMYTHLWCSVGPNIRGWFAKWCVNTIPSRRFRAAVTPYLLYDQVQDEANRQDKNALLVVYEQLLLLIPNMTVQEVCSMLVFIGTHIHMYQPDHGADYQPQSEEIHYIKQFNELIAMEGDALISCLSCGQRQPSDSIESQLELVKLRVNDQVPVDPDLWKKRLLYGLMVTPLIYGGIVVHGSLSFVSAQLMLNEDEPKQIPCADDILHYSDSATGLGISLLATRVMWILYWMHADLWRISDRIGAVNQADWKACCEVLSQYFQDFRRASHGERLRMLGGQARSGLKSVLRYPGLYTGALALAVIPNIIVTLKVGQQNQLGNAISIGGKTKQFCDAMFITYTLVTTAKGIYRLLVAPILDRNRVGNRWWTWKRFLPTFLFRLWHRREIARAEAEARANGEVLLPAYLTDMSVMEARDLLWRVVFDLKQYSYRTDLQNRSSVVYGDLIKGLSRTKMAELRDYIKCLLSIYRALKDQHGDNNVVLTASVNESTPFSGIHVSDEVSSPEVEHDVDGSEGQKSVYGTWGNQDPVYAESSFAFLGSGGFIPYQPGELAGAEASFTDSDTAALLEADEALS